eukprot:gnl/TRDRNA2_/TRDRNA2_160171_c0_seq3.p1 gnl/TRDRNA2_/TRDRNA2_160171_c0~~gnl/TRDRNA2_/TRDRNA2_160171_c0_seq3.p1  ORF type:complete len:730 (-),score=183.42 gnl/TRDRNA2_/TRDRNA2_160171_c0_seq3:148-2337(-)
MSLVSDAEEETTGIAYEEVINDTDRDVSVAMRKPGLQPNGEKNYCWISQVLPPGDKWKVPQAPNFLHEIQVMYLVPGSKYDVKTDIKEFWFPEERGQQSTVYVTEVIGIDTLPPFDPKQLQEARLRKKREEAEEKLQMKKMHERQAKEREAEKIAKREYQKKMKELEKAERIRNSVEDEEVRKTVAAGLGLAPAALPKPSEVSHQPQDTHSAKKGQRAKKPKPPSSIDESEEAEEQTEQAAKKQEKLHPYTGRAKVTKTKDIERKKKKKKIKENFDMFAEDSDEVFAEDSDGDASGAQRDGALDTDAEGKAKSGRDFLEAINDESGRFQGSDTEQGLQDNQQTPNNDAQEHPRSIQGDDAQGFQYAEEEAIADSELVNAPLSDAQHAPESNESHIFQDKDMQDHESVQNEGAEDKKDFQDARGHPDKSGTQQEPAVASHAVSDVPYIPKSSTVQSDGGAVQDAQDRQEVESVQDRGAEDMKDDGELLHTSGAPPEAAIAFQPVTDVPDVYESTTVQKDALAVSPAPRDDAVPSIRGALGVGEKQDAEDEDNFAVSPAPRDNAVSSVSGARDVGEAQDTETSALKELEKAVHFFMARGRKHIQNAPGASALEADGQPPLEKVLTDLARDLRPHRLDGEATKALLELEKAANHFVEKARGGTDSGRSMNSVRKTDQLPSLLSAAKPRNDCFETSVPGMLGMLSFFLALMGLKKWRSFRKPLSDLGESLIRT